MNLVALVLLAQAPEGVRAIDALARERDSAGVLRFCEQSLRAQPERFGFLKRNGAFGTGRFGWRARELTLPGAPKRYVVFSTPLTSEDLGEQLFEWNGARLTKFVPEAESFGYRFERQLLTVRFDPPAKSVRITAKVRLRRERGAQSHAMIRLSPDYRVSAVLSESRRPIGFRQAGGIVLFRAPDTPRAEIQFRYSAVVDRPRFAGSISTEEATLTNDYWYPMIARRPCAYDLTVYSPRNWVVIGQGEQVSLDMKSTQRVTRFRMDLPVTIWSLTAGPFPTMTHRIGDRAYYFWSKRLTREQARIQAELFHPVIEFYGRFAPYPFKTWGALESPQYGGGALEAYSHATYGGGLPWDDAHEPAHTWWGGLINNTYLNSFWNESFAVYSDGLYRREGPVGNKAEKRLAFVSGAGPQPGYDAAPLAQSGADLGEAALALGYGKGAKVLQMLELELGTAKMLDCMRQWIATHPKGTPGEWSDFERVVLQVGGNRMRRFFDDWVRGVGHPDFDVIDVEWKEGRVLGRALFAGRAYALPCEVLIQSASGKRSYAQIRFEPPKGSQAANFSIPCPVKPELVSFDPWRRLLRRYGDDEEPITLTATLASAKRFSDPNAMDWLSNVPTEETLTSLPADLDGVFLVASPKASPAMRDLCRRAGFTVTDDRLTYDGTTIDLNRGAAMAVVELGGGRRCVIGLGKCAMPPNAGRARLAVFDELGRFLRGVTEPKTAGFLTYRL